MILLVLICIFIDREKSEIQEVSYKATEIETESVLQLGILNFDTFNPIESKNEQVQQISKLIYEPLFNSVYFLQRIYDI